MRFARSAERYSEQNLILRQERGQLYFTSTRTINPRQELRVWYSPEYAEARGLKVLRPSPEDLGKFFPDYLLYIIIYLYVLLSRIYHSLRHLLRKNFNLKSVHFKDTVGRSSVHSKL